MGLHIPGLTEALQKLDDTSEKMDALVVGINEVVGLLKEQNELLRNK